MSKKILIIVVLIFIIAIAGGYIYLKQSKENPEEILNEYISNINDGMYEKMYDMLDEECKQKISKEDLITQRYEKYRKIGGIL